MCYSLLPIISFSGVEPISNSVVTLREPSQVEYRGFYTAETDKKKALLCNYT